MPISPINWGVFPGDNAMRPTLPLAVLGSVLVLLGLAHQGFCQAKFYQASYQHFQEFAIKANELNASLENPGEKNILNYFTASSLLYAARAHCLAQLADLRSHQVCEEDKTYALGKLSQSQSLAVSNIPEDLRVLEGMQGLLKTKGVKNLGVQLINELRVLQHNAEADKP
jgi:hypothetical protein